MRGWARGVVARLPRYRIQVGMGVALLIAAATFVLAIFDIAAVGGDATGLSGANLAIAFACPASFLGALMTIGVGMYAPTMVVISLMGMNPLAAFPIMMGSAAFLMPVGGPALPQGRPLWADGSAGARDRRRAGRADRGVHRGVTPAERTCAGWWSWWCCTRRY